MAALTALLAEVSAKTENGQWTLSYDAAVLLAQKIHARRSAATGSTSTWSGPFRGWEEFDIWLDSTTIDGVANEGAVPLRVQHRSGAPERRP